VVMLHEGRLLARGRAKNILAETATTDMASAFRQLTDAASGSARP
jgi:hypothetical protein